PCDRLKHRALVDGLQFVNDAAIEGHNPPRRQIERPPLSPQQRVTTEALNRYSTVGLMNGNLPMRFQRCQHHTKIVVFDQCLRVLATLPLRFSMELIDLAHEIKFEKRS